MVNAIETAKIKELINPFFNKKKTFLFDLLTEKGILNKDEKWYTTNNAITIRIRKTHQL